MSASPAGFSHTLMEKLAQVRTPAADNRGGLDGLTRRELDILECLCEGQSNTEIADSLHLSPNTVRNHLANFYDKIGVNNRSAAVIRDRERGLIQY